MNRLTIHANEIEAIQREHISLKALDVKTLREMIALDERVVDTREIGKVDAIFRILRNRHGHQRLIAAGLVSSLAVVATGRRRRGVNFRT